MFYKTGVLKFKKSLTKTKIQYFKLNYFQKKNFNISYKSLSTNFLDQHDIKVALHKNI
jgi:hypothetical protein